MIGAIADDFTGGTDVAVAFRRAGLRTAIVFGAPEDTTDLTLPAVDALVVALKTRTVPAANAVALSMHAARWLRTIGATQLYFKYCSTFDSRPEGNIGPVADALAELMDADTVAVVPASPEHGRTQYRGHLFVHQQLLSDSPMRNHPLTPMTNPRIPEVLAAQTTATVQLVPYEAVRAGVAALTSTLGTGPSTGVRYAVIDAIDDDDLSTIGAAVRDASLITGAAGLAGGLGRALAATTGAQQPLTDPVGPVRSAVLAGSCSSRTLEQIERYRAVHRSWFMDVLATPDVGTLVEQATRFIDGCAPDESPLVYSSVAPETLQRIQETLGADRASELLEEATGQVAQVLRQRGFRRIISAGGETSGAVTTALTTRRGLIGAEQAPGVPWIYTDDGLALLLKSGNFGEPDMLLRAVADHQPEHV